MLEKIPDYNRSHKASHSNSTGVDLAPLVISPSVLLFRLEVFVYIFMLIAASVAIFPFISTAFYWSFLWLAFLAMIIAAVRTSLRNKNCLPVTLGVTKKIWCLQTFSGSVAVEPCNEILVWSQLIILPVKEVQSGRKRRIIALPDSMKTEDWRRLRVWLRMELRKK